MIELLSSIGLVHILYTAFYMFKFDKKPFNCPFCISAWTGLILTVCTYQVYFLTLPLLYEIVMDLKRRL